MRYNKDYTNVRTEYFYWHSSSLLMLAKQGHTIKRWLENQTVMPDAWNPRKIVKTRTDQEKILRNLIYTTWNNNWFQVDKPVNRWHTQMDQWVYNDPNFAKYRSTWREGIKYISERLPEYTNFTDSGLGDSLKIFTKTYSLGKLNYKYNINK
jgi:hypothetical protein